MPSILDTQVRVCSVEQDRIVWVILPRARRPNRAPLNGRLVKDACSTFSYEEIVCRVDTINVRSFGPRSRVMPKGTVKDDLRGSEGRSSFEVDFGLIDACCRCLDGDGTGKS